MRWNVRHDSTIVEGSMAEDVFRIVGTTQAGAFRVDEVIAEGGFAVVYRAYHQSFRAKVALKCLKVPETLEAQHYAEFLERFREEGELLFRLSSSSPAVVRPLHVGILEGTDTFVPFIALEWLDGQTLEEMIAARAQRGEPPLTLKEALRLLTPAARALERAHHFPGPTGEMCILHRDIKPENIFVAHVHGELTAKILDFGIGKVKSVATQMVGHQSAQADGLVAFTPAYGAPEQWLPKRFGQTGPWTDVWGMALTLLAVIIGRSPLDGDQAALLGSAIDPGRRPTPRNEGLAVPDMVEAVFHKAVAVDPRDRYQDVGEFWSDLHRAAGIREGVVSMPPPAPGAAAQLQVSMPADPRGFLHPLASPPRQSDPYAQTRASSHEVPDLDLGIQAAAARPAQRAESKRPAKITLARDGLGPGAAAASSAIGGGLVDDELEVSVRGVPMAQPTRGSLDGIGLSPRPVPVRPPVARYGARDPGPGPSTAMVKERLRGPIKLVIVGILVMAGDFAYSEYTGELLRFGPVRPLWIAGPIVVLGIAAAFVRLFQTR
jgi:serine/threonine-protein kinase